MYGLLRSNVPVIPDGKDHTKFDAYNVPVAFICTGFVPQVITSVPAFAIGFLSIKITTSSE